MANIAAKKKTTGTANAQKAKKGKMKIVAFVAALALIGCIALFINIGGLAKMEAEKAASKALGVKVTMTTLDVSLQEKQITVTGLRVGNPDGYGTPYAMTAGNIKINVEDMKKGLLTFSEISASDTDINLEVREHGSNLTDIRKSAQANTAAAKRPESGEVKVIIRKTQIGDITLNPVKIMEGTQTAAVTLPMITITGIGEKTNGVLAGEAIAQVVDYVVQVASRSAIKSGMFAGMAPESLQVIQQDLGLPAGFIEQVRSLGDKAADTVKDLFEN